MTREEIKTNFEEQDKYAKLTGIKIDSVGEGKAVGHIDLRPEHLNGAGSVQGGALFTLADSVCAAAANFGIDGIAVTLQSNVQYLRGASQGRLTATAHVAAPHPKLPSFTVEVTDSEGRQVFISTSIFYVKKPYQQKQ